MQGHTDRAFTHFKTLADLGRAFAFQIDGPHYGGRAFVQLPDQHCAVTGGRGVMRRGLELALQILDRQVNCRSAPAKASASL